MVNKLVARYWIYATKDAKKALNLDEKLSEDYGEVEQLKADISLVIPNLLETPIQTSQCSIEDRYFEATHSLPEEDLEKITLEGNDIKQKLSYGHKHIYLHSINEFDESYFSEFLGMFKDYLRAPNSFDGSIRIRTEDFEAKEVYFSIRRKEKRSETFDYMEHSREYIFLVYPKKKACAFESISNFLKSAGLNQNRIEEKIKNQRKFEFKFNECEYSVEDNYVWFWKGVALYPIGGILEIQSRSLNLNSSPKPEEIEKIISNIPEKLLVEKRDYPQLTNQFVHYAF